VRETTELDIAALKVSEWMQANRDTLIIEEWKRLFDDLDSLVEIAEWLEGDICPFCTSDNVMKSPLIDFQNCHDCGHSW
jgi:hypothetical protein